MVQLASLEEATRQQYHLKVMGELLTQAHIIGVELEEFVCFFATQVQAMLACPPNLQVGDGRVWVMRGFYPGTPVFFKLTVVSTITDDSRMSYHAKASPLRVMWHHPKYKSRKYDEHVYLMSEKLNENITLRMENTFFGANHKIEPLLEKKPKMPRCMSPKGLKLFRYEKPKKRKARAKSDD